ncbi:Hypothetical_protein [Hexamita inflata]|uniref:Hypothetical_protein n=1 Tax=Hexamita inflata TaxID=28002 RepID=A0AA86NWP4_9EUKA|nr:Hypothetical protein HINF_LOCUS15205 [Hexamita inflata]
MSKEAKIKQIQCSILNYQNQYQQVQNNINLDYNLYTIINCTELTDIDTQKTNQKRIGNEFIKLFDLYQDISASIKQLQPEEQTQHIFDKYNSLQIQIVSQFNFDRMKQEQIEICKQIIKLVEETKIVEYARNNNHTEEFDKAIQFHITTIKHIISSQNVKQLLTVVLAADDFRAQTDLKLIE